MTVSQKAYAKINLTLDVVGKRADGYHDLVSVMQRISLHDTLHASRVEGEGIHLSTDSTLPTDEGNLIVRAAKAYFAASGAPFGVAFSLEKRIPMQAGLGGGSADAAATLHALNCLDGMRFSTERLCEIGAAVGADVPFCVAGGTQLCRGIGERMQPVESRLRAHLAVAMAGEGVSTPRAFADLDALYGDFAIPAGEAEERTARLAVSLERGDLLATSFLLYNCFEEVICPVRPAVGQIKQALLANGALAACMSGSGPAVFGLFESKKAAEAAAEALAQGGVTAFACEME